MAPKRLIPTGGRRPAFGIEAEIGSDWSDALLYGLTEEEIAVVENQKGDPDVKTLSRGFIAMDLAQFDARDLYLFAQPLKFKPMTAMKSVQRLYGLHRRLPEAPRKKIIASKLRFKLNWVNR